MNFQWDPWLFRERRWLQLQCQHQCLWKIHTMESGAPVRRWRRSKMSRILMDKMTKGVWLLNKYWEFPKSQTWNLSCSMEELVGHFERCQCNLRQGIFVRDLAFCDGDTKQESIKHFGYVCKLACQKHLLGHFFLPLLCLISFLARPLRESKMSSFCRPWSSWKQLIRCDWLMWLETYRSHKSWGIWTLDIFGTVFKR